MTAVTKLRMTADEFIPWAMAQPRRYELVSGEVVAMSPERAGHARTKYRVWESLRASARERALPCEVLGDGPAVRIDRNAVYEPDALLRCGDPVDDDVVEIADPVIVVEVGSPSTQAVDAGLKLADYFRLPSLRHYLIVNTASRSVIHHERLKDGRIETRIVRSGPLALDPPGIVVAVESFFAD